MKKIMYMVALGLALISAGQAALAYGVRTGSPEKRRGQRVYVGPLLSPSSLSRVQSTREAAQNDKTSIGAECPIELPRLGPRNKSSSRALS
jgi:hypothetical protein